MANITLLGVNYADVPAIDLPQTGGGTVRFSEGGGVSRTVIAAQQTVNVSSFYTQLSASGPLTLGEVYSFTLDGTEYIGTATDNGGLPSVGGADFYATGQNGAISSYGTSLYLVCQSNGQHTIKVEKLTGI